MRELTSDAFAAFLAGSTLEEISVWEVFVTRQSESEGKKRQYHFGDQAELVSSSPDRAVIYATYGILVKEDESEIANLEVTLKACYQTPELMTPEIFEQFRQVTLRIHTIPFAREWFRDMSGRMGIEPILLPLAIAHPAAVRRRPTKSSEAVPARIRKKVEG